MSLREHATTIFQAALQAVDPTRLITEQVTFRHSTLLVKDRQFDLDQYQKIYVVGFGKAAAVMAQALERILGERIAAGLVIVKYGHEVACERITVRQAGHPVLDQNGLNATADMLELLSNATEQDLVICLISGGGSALLESLPTGITLADLQATFQSLLACGATIEEMNAVRKHLSRVKGGHLLKTIAPATCLSLILSDVIGDHLETIASAPTAPDPTTFVEVEKIVQRFDLWDSLPLNVRRHFEQGSRGEIADTLKAGDPLFENVTNLILGNNLTALIAAKRAAQTLGYNAIILSSRVQGEAREVGRVMAGVLQEMLISDNPVARPACVLFGGETTVTLQGTGKGGRNQELALAALCELSEVEDEFALLCCGTDGTDGPTDAAGAVVSPEVIRSARQQSLDQTAYLSKNDAYHFFERTGGLVITGPTGTNVMDFGAILVGHNGNISKAELSS